MAMVEIEKRRHEILDALCKELNDEQIAAVVNKEEGAPEMVSAILDELGDADMDITGDFFFRPLLTEEEEIWNFMSVITVSDQVPEERLSELYEAMSYVNFNLPGGCFSIDKDHRFLCYVLTALIPGDLENEEMFRVIDISVGNAFAISDNYIGILSDVLNGKIGADGVVEFLGGPAEEED